MNQRRTTKRIDRAALLREELHQIQGETPGVLVAGKTYKYKLLKRERCQRTLYELIPPFLELVKAVLGSGVVPIKDIFEPIIKAAIAGEKMPDIPDFDYDFSKVDLGVISAAFRSMPWAEFWSLAQALLDGVTIDTQGYGKLKDHEYYDDKQPELISAMLMGLRVNYPHLVAFLPKASGGDDSTPDETDPERAEE